MSQGHHERSPRWAPFEGDPSHKQVHALEFIAESLDRIEGHLDGISASLAGSGLHKCKPPPSAA